MSPSRVHEIKPNMNTKCEVLEREQRLQLQVWMRKARMGVAISPGCSVVPAVIGVGGGCRYMGVN